MPVTWAWGNPALSSSCRGKSVGCGIRSGFGCWLCHVWAVRAWTSYIALLSSSFPIFMGIVIAFLAWLFKGFEMGLDREKCSVKTSLLVVCYCCYHMDTCLINPIKCCLFFRRLLMDLPGVGGFLQFSLWTPDTSCQFCQWSLWRNGWQRYSISWPIFLETNLSNSLLGSSFNVTLTWLRWWPGCLLPLHLQCWFEKCMETLVFFYFILFPQPPESCGSANEYPQLGFRPLRTCTGKHTANVC